MPGGVEGKLENQKQANGLKEFHGLFSTTICNVSVFGEENE